MTSSGADAISRLVLDTTAYSRLRFGDARVLDLVAAADSVYVPATVLGELEAIFECGRHQQENRRMLAEFLAEPWVSVLPTTPEVARRYGELLDRLRQSGTPVPVNGVWIAAATVDCGGHLLTFDRAFGRILELQRTVLVAGASARRAGSV